MLEHLQKYNSNILKWVLKCKNIQKSTYFKHPIEILQPTRKPIATNNLSYWNTFRGKISEPLTCCSKEAAFLPAMVLPMGTFSPLSEMMFSAANSLVATWRSAARELCKHNNILAPLRVEGTAGRRHEVYQWQQWPEPSSPLCEERWGERWGQMREESM